MSGRPPIAWLVLTAWLSGCGAGGGDGATCDLVREQAKSAAETGVRLRAEPSPDSAQIETSARDYVLAVRSRPDCFTQGQRDNAEEIDDSLPSEAP